MSFRLTVTTSAANARRVAFVAVILGGFAFASPRHQLMATVIAPNLPAGSQYQLIFVTAGSHDATSSDIADYNAFVQHEASLSSSLPAGATWDAVASTSDVAAISNAPSPGVAIYNTHGDLVIPAGAGLYGAPNIGGISIDATVGDQYGNTNLGNGGSFAFWSGTDVYGHQDQVLGGALANWGLVNPPGSSDNPNPIILLRFLHQNDTRQAIPFLALSSPITVPAPEPGTLTLLGSAAVLIGGMGFLRRRRSKKS